MPSKPRFLAISHLKGGSGATTVAVNLAAGLALRGQETALFDLDPLGAATFHLIDNQPETGIVDALDHRGRLSDCLVATSVPKLRLAAASSALVVWDRRPERFPVDLARVFAEVPEDIEVVVLDLPPSYGSLVRGTLAVLPGGEVLATVQTRALDLVGFSDLVRLVDELQEQNPELHLSGVIPVRTNRTSLSAEVVEALKKGQGDRLLPGIRDSIVVARAPLSHKPVQLTSPRSRAVEDFEALVEAVLQAEPKHDYVIA